MTNFAFHKAALALFCVVASPSHAVTVTTTFIEADANGQVQQSSLPNPGTRVQATSTEVFAAEFPDVATLTAVQDENGFSQVSATVSNSGIDAFAANGDLTQHTLTTSAKRGISFENLTNQAARVTFDFRISGIELEVVNAGGGPNAPEATAAFSASAFNANTGATVDNFFAVLELEGAYNNFFFDRQEGFTGTIERQDCFYDTCQRGVATVDALSGSLDLGVLQPGDWYGVTTSLAGGIYFNGTELGARMSATDPNGSQFSWTITPVDLAPVPLPASGLLLLGSLFATVVSRQIIA